MCLQSNTALSQNGLVQSLVEDVKRRLLTTSEDVPDRVRCNILDAFAQKMLNSGHSLKETRRNTLAGVKGYEAKFKKARQSSSPMNRSAKQSSAGRRRKKLTGKSDWFRKTSGNNNVSEVSKENNNKVSSVSKGNYVSKVNSKNEPSVCKENITTPELRVSSVLFVEQSKGGSLAESIRTTVRRLSPMLGFTVKVVENAGSKLGSVLSNKDPWAGQMCGRPKCPPCTQDEEDVEACKATNILYESLCKDCNPGKKAIKNSALYDDRLEASIYVGETSRSLFCRSSEHQRDYKSQKEDSHMIKHWITSHQGQEKPKFIQRVVNKYKSALDRQVGEAVRIQLRGNTLNSLCGFNRSKVTRLVVDKEWDSKVWKENFDQKLIQTVLADEEDIDIGTVRNAKRRLEGIKQDDQPNTQIFKNKEN